MNEQDTLYPLKVQWRAEHRILSREVWRKQARLKELEDMLDAFFGVKANG